MILIVTPDTILNRGALEVRRIPKPILGRGITLYPRKGLFGGLTLRLIFEHALPRYLLALWPFPVAMFIWPHLALPISQAPLLMFIVIYLVESRVLSVPKDRRDALIDRTEALQALDTLRLRSAAYLTRLAAGRRMRTGDLHLVVEQSALAKVPPLTLISVQIDDGAPRLLDLTREERDALRTALFDEALSERTLLRVNLSEDEFLRDTVLDAATVSAHARLAAMAGR
jgi:hypothetical protein